MRTSLFMLASLATMLSVAGCGDDDGVAADAAGIDAGSGAVDAGVADAGMVTLPDAAGVDAGLMCSPAGGVACGGATSCLCCPAGGPSENCTCSTSCMSASDCTDPTRPICNRWTTSSMPGICTSAAFYCCWGCR